MWSHTSTSCNNSMTVVGYYDSLAHVQWDSHLIYVIPLIVSIVIGHWKYNPHFKGPHLFHNKVWCQFLPTNLYNYQGKDFAISMSYVYHYTVHDWEILHTKRCIDFKSLAANWGMWRISHDGGEKSDGCRVSEWEKVSYGRSGPYRTDIKTMKLLWINCSSNPWVEGTCCHRSKPHSLCLCLAGARSYTSHDTCLTLTFKAEHDLAVI